MLCSLVINIARSAWGKKGAKMSTPMDFLPKWGQKYSEEKEAKQQSVEEMKKIIMSIAKSGGKKK